MEFKHRRFTASAPTADLPMRTNKLNFRMRYQIEQQGMLSAIELLRKCGQRLRAPSRTISRTVDAHINRFLLNNVGDLESQQKYSIRGAADIQRWPIPFCIDDGFQRKQKSLDHSARIVAN